MFAQIAVRADGCTRCRVGNHAGVCGLRRIWVESLVADSSGGLKSSDKAELFTIPQEQMAHVQVLTVQPATLPRTLRLTGAVAYNSFRTTPVITQVSGPVSRVVVVPGQKVKKGEPMLYVASPDYSQLRTNYLKAKDAYALAQRRCSRPRFV